MNKRVGGIFLLILLLSSILINIGFVSAQGELGEGAKEIGSQIWSVIEPTAIFLFNIEEGSSGSVAAQTILSFVFAFIIVFVFLLLVAKNIPLTDEYPGISKFLMVIFSLVGIRGIAQISPSIMNDIFLPYSVVALSIINGSIFVGWFVLVNIGMSSSKLEFARRFMWILFAVTFIGVWWLRTFSEEGITALMQWIYLGTTVLAVAMAFLDGTIQGFWSGMKAKKLEKINKTQQLANFYDERKTYRKQVEDNTITSDQFNDLMDNLKKRVRILLGTKVAKKF